MTFEVPTYIHTCVSVYGIVFLTLYASPPRTCSGIYCSSWAVCSFRCEIYIDNPGSYLNWYHLAPVLSYSRFQDFRMCLTCVLNTTRVQSDVVKVICMCKLRIKKYSFIYWPYRFGFVALSLEFSWHQFVRLIIFAVVLFSKNRIWKLGIWLRFLFF